MRSRERTDACTFENTSDMRSRSGTRKRRSGADQHLHRDAHVIMGMKRPGS